MIGTTLGRYRVFEKIGAGGMGEVYLAHDDRLERDVALKVLPQQTKGDEQTRKRFRKEALTLSRLNHPNIATVLDFDTQDGVDFLVMEYIVGTPLSETIDKGPLNEHDIVLLAIQIAHALDEAHARGVVHRDLKPNNLIVNQKGQLKVLDFGLAKLVQPASFDADTLSRISEANLIIGTLGYMSPEQLRSEPVDARSDIYSFGVVLYEMATGRRPHMQTQPISLADAVLHKAPPAPAQIRRELSPLLQQIILKCLEKDPQFRYQSVKELMTDLRRLETPSMTDSPFLTMRTARNWKVPLRWLAVVAVLAVVIAIGALMFQNAQKIQKKTEAPAVAATVRSVVALPSKIYGPPENQFLSEAIPNALSTYLSRIENMETKVPPTNADMERFQGNMDRAAAFYGVGAVIASSLTTDGGRLILNVQLVDAATRRLIWSENYEGQRENYLTLVRTAAEGIRSMLRPGDKPIPSAGTNRSTDAEFAYERGFYYMRAYLNKKDPGDFDRASADLQKALELDATNARAAAAIARLYVGRFEAGAPVGEIVTEIDRWGYRALQLDYRCGEAWQVLSVSEEWRPQSDPRKRLEYALRAATYAAQSGYSHHVLASALARNSSVLSLAAAREGIQRDPMHLNGALFASGILARQGQYSDGLRLTKQVLSVEPQMAIGLLMDFWLLLGNHQYQDAEKYKPALEKLVAERRLHPGLVAFGQEWLDFEKNRALGKKEETAAALHRLISEARGQAPPFPRWELVTGNILPIQAKFDSVDGTVETLTIRSSLGIAEPYDWLVLAPQFAEARKDPRFERIAAASRVKFEGLLSDLDAASKRNELPPYLEKALAQLRNLK